MLDARRLCPVLVCLLAVTPVSMAVNFTGSLSSEDGGILGSGPWVTETTPTTLVWVVDNETTPGYWHYSYTFAVPRKDISHLIIEISPDLTYQEKRSLYNSMTWSGGVAEFQTYRPGPGTPNLPASFYGMKLDVSASDTALSFSFDTLRMPVWGDFYAKDGKEGQVDCTVWNAGFLTPDPPADPADPGYVAPANGAYLNKLLVPDTQTGPGAGTLEIIKFFDGAVPPPEWDPAGWEFRLEGGPDQVNLLLTTGGDGSVSQPGLTPGDYTLTEINIPPAWQLTRVLYDGLEWQNGLTVAVVDGQTTSVMFGNIPEPATGK